MKKIFFYLMFSGIVLFAKSQTGLDPSFGTAGVGIYSPANQSQALATAIQADGKIVVGGLASANPMVAPVIRLLPNGSMDAGFNGTGSVLVPGMNSIESIAIQPDGKIVMGGIGFDPQTSYNVFQVIRLNPDGTYDNTFGTNGNVYVDIVFGVDYGLALALQQDGKIVMAGNSQIPGGDFDISIVRLLSNGSLDNSFDGDGKMVLERPGTTEYENGLLVQPDGKILIEGKTYLGSDPDLIVARINPGGGLDNGFGINGVFSFEEIDGYEPYFGKTLALQPDGKILVGRNSNIGDGITKYIALRINPNGTLDNSFSGDGIVTVTFGGGEEICTAIALQPDGKIVLSGYSITAYPNSDLAMARLHSDGSFDNCFDQDGKLVISHPGWDEPVDMVLQADGKIVVAGYTYTTSSSFIVMRIQSTGGTGVDADGDGYNSCVDCNDNNPAIHPGATEICNGVDEDCDGVIDDGVQLTFYRDLDGDTYGNPAITQLACSAPPGFVTNNTDCNDNNAAIHPGAVEVCNTLDDDCDGQIDEGVLSTFYRDFDGDGYGNAAISTQACTVPPGYVNNSTDCNDNNVAIYPGAPEVCNGIDDDCDGQIDEEALLTFYRDFDTDGYGNPAITTQACTAPAGYVSNNTDCNDNNAAIHPGATEICNSVDDDCDGFIDEGLQSNFYRDLDADGFGNPAINILACTAPPGYVANNTDCNDNNAAIYPGATEVCNSVDDDCDGLIDEGVQTTFYRDLDGDGYGNAAVTILACSVPGGYVANSTDCNDNNAAVHPGATEVCNTMDDDCDGQIDEGVQITFYRDFDSDGYGNAAVTILACSPPAGYVANNTDCNDNNAAIHPGATEVCNTVDDDCDGLIDEGCSPDNDGDGYTIAQGDCNDNDPAIHPGATEVCNTIDDDCDGQVDEGVQSTFYRDFDGDGYGNAAITTQACTAPPGYVSNSTDCNDNNAAIHPGATEVCNSVDDDCDGQIDEGVQSTFYRDFDTDGYGNAAITTQACTAPPGYVSNSTDCNDNNAAIHPGATEVCNSVDDDCDGQIDEGVQSTFYRDFDGDGYGNAAITTQACTAPPGYVSNSTDCNDNNAAIHPGATEVCNSVDDDCDGQIDEGVQSTFYRDFDTDGYGNPAITTQACAAPPGYVSNGTDCNDNNSAVHPGATEICNGTDDDCDELIDEDVQLTFYLDFDTDGFGNAAITTQACVAPPGYVNNNTDCNDNNAAIHPGAAEVCNTVDDDCDGQVDEGCTPDNDGDGYTVAQGDCNDNDPAIHPGATEVCNTVDDDCDGVIDEGVQTTFYRDLDNDSYGNAAVTTLACAAPPGYVINNTDCNDNNAAIHPGAVEICANGVDDNCNGQVDENTAIAIISPAGTANLCAGSNLLLSANTGPGLTYQWYRNNTALAGQTGATLTATTNGNYSVRVTNSGNCTATSAVTIVNTVNAPNAGISTPGGGNNCPLNMQAHPGGQVTYQWNMNNVPITGATQRNYTATVSGSYTVTVTKDGCPGVSSPVVVSTCLPSIAIEYTKNKEETIFEKQRFKIYPNPASESFMIELNLVDKTSSEATIQLTTLSGSILVSQKTVLVKGRLQQKIQLNRQWSDNIYIVRVITEKQVFTERLVIMKQ